MTLCSNSQINNNIDLYFSILTQEVALHCGFIKIS